MKYSYETIVLTFPSKPPKNDSEACTHTKKTDRQVGGKKFITKGAKNVTLSSVPGDSDHLIPITLSVREGISIFFK